MTCAAHPRGDALLLPEEEPGSFIKSPHKSVADERDDLEFESEDMRFWEKVASNRGKVFPREDRVEMGEKRIVLDGNIAPH